jgi:hypothetical protein
METLFRFSIVRPPLARDPRYPPILLAQESAFQTKLKGIVTSLPADLRGELEKAGEEYLESDLFVSLALLDDDNKKLVAFDNALDKLPSETTEHAAASQAATATLGVSPDQFLQTDWARSMSNRLKDSIIALHVLGFENETGHLEVLVKRLRGLNTIRKISEDTSFPFDSSDLARWRRRPVVVPDFGELKPVLSTATQRDELWKKSAAALDAKKEIMQTLFDDRRKLQAALNAVKGLPAVQPVSAPVQFTQAELSSQHLKLLHDFSSLSLKFFENAIPRATMNLNDRETAVPRMALQTGTADLAGGAGGFDIPEMSRSLLDRIAAIKPETGSAAFTPVTDKTTPLMVKPTVTSALSPEVQATLSSKNIDLTSRPYPSSVKQLQNLMQENAAALNAHYRDLESPVSKVYMIGNTAIRRTNVGSSVDWSREFDRGGRFPPGMSEFAINFPFAPKGAQRRVTVLGVADLLVVKQQLIGYEKGDVAYVENVLKGETRTHAVENHTSVTQDTLLETETTKTTETNTEQTNRFEMSEEAQKTIKESESLKAGVTVSASYGPSVQWSANASGSMDRSKEEAGKIASSFSSDVTSKASEKIQARVLKRTETKTLSEFTEKESHVFENKEPTAKNISGVYQWLNKVYEAQVWNYGQRTILDFMIPEPGAFLLDKMMDPKGSKPDDVTVPNKFTATVDQITPASYMNYAQDLGVTDLEQPPEAVSGKSASWSAAQDQPHVHNENIAIPAGFKVTDIIARASGVQSDGWIDVSAMVTCVSAQTYPKLHLHLFPVRGITTWARLTKR